MDTFATAARVSVLRAAPVNPVVNAAADARKLSATTRNFITDDELHLAYLALRHSLELAR